MHVCVGIYVWVGERVQREWKRGRINLSGRSLFLEGASRRASTRGSEILKIGADFLLGGRCIPNIFELNSFFFSLSAN